MVSQNTISENRLYNELLESGIVIIFWKYYSNFINIQDVPFLIVLLWVIHSKKVKNLWLWKILSSFVENLKIFIIVNKNMRCVAYSKKNLYNNVTILVMMNFSNCKISCEQNQWKAYITYVIKNLLMIIVIITLTAVL